MKALHNRGDIVTVYYDTWTKKQVEGSAVLISCTSNELSKWLVRFVITGYVCERTI